MCGRTRYGAVSGSSGSVREGSGASGSKKGCRGMGSKHLCQLGSVVSLSLAVESAGVLSVKGCW